MFAFVGATSATLSADRMRLLKRFFISSLAGLVLAAFVTWAVWLYLTRTEDGGGANHGSSGRLPLKSLTSNRAR